MLKKIKENIVLITTILTASIIMGTYASDFVLYAARDTHDAITSDIAALKE